MKSNSQKYLFNSIPLWETLKNYNHNNYKSLILIWFASTFVSIFLGIIAHQNDWNGVPISFFGLDFHITLYFHIVIPILLCLWLGFWWGFIPAFLTSFISALFSGMPFYWSFLFGFVDILGLLVLVIAFRSVPVSLNLHSFAAIAFYIFISFLSTISTSPGAIILAFANTNLSAHDISSTWQGWWVGGFLLRSVVSGFLLFFTTSFVYKWKENFKQKKSWQPLNPNQIKNSLLISTIVFFIFMFINRLLTKLNLDEFLTKISDKNLKVEIYSTFDGIVLTDWILFTFIILIAYFSYRVARNWNKSLEESLETLSEKLKNKEDNYYSLFDQASDAIFIIDTEGNYRDVNTRTCNLLGYSKEEIVKLNIIDQLDQNSMTNFSLRSKALLNGEEIISRVILKTKIGKSVDGELSAKLLKDGRILGVFRNLTERKRVEENLIVFGKILDESFNEIYMFDAETLKFILVNLGAQKNLGYSVSEIQSLTPLDINPELSHEKFIELIQILSSGEQEIIEFESVHKRKDDSLYSVKVHLQLSKFNNKPVYFEIINDISTHIRSQKELTRMNRALRALSEGNQIIIHSEDENDLLHEMCRIIVEIGKYKLSWIGYAENDTYKSVNPVAQYGYEEGYLEKLKISWSDNVSGRGPTGTSIRKGKTSINKDIQLNKINLDWKAEALKRGYKSSIALPLFIDNKVFGALNIYASERGAFDNDEVKLLEELATDLSFGIETLRTRKQRQVVANALRESEKRYRNIVETANEGIWIFDDKLTTTFTNKKMLEILGLSEEEILGKPLKLFFHEKHDFNTEQHLKRSNKGKSTQYDFKLKYKNGNFIWALVNINPIFDENEKFVGSLAMVTDITKRKVAEDQLKKLSSAVKQSPASIVITDSNGNIEYVNPKFIEVTGYELSEVIGKNPRFLKSGIMSKDFYEKMWNEIKSGNVWIGEIYNKKKNGELFWELASISAITNENNEITNFVAVKEDITQHKIIEANLIEARNKAERSDKLKTEFLAQMSHEIRTPLNSLLSYSKLIEDEVINFISDDIKEGFHILHTSGNRILRTINLILNMSEIQTGNYDFNPKKIDLYADILNQLYLEFLMNAKNKNLDLQLTNETENSTVFGDEYSLNQIFYNLIDNAIKYTNNGQIEIKIYNENTLLCVDIKDTGLGISNDFQNNLFDPFRQEEQGYTRNFDGNGLGLALVKKYCELNSVEISVRSKKGSGSTFKVKFINHRTLK